jgi:hypothetical protein
MDCIVEIMIQGNAEGGIKIAGYGQRASSAILPDNFRAK